MDNTYLIAVNTPISRTPFLYQSDEVLSVGDLVEVPFGAQKAVGGVVLKKETLASAQTHNPNLNIEMVKKVTQKGHPFFHISEQEFKLFEYVSNYYAYPLGKLIFDVFPALTKNLNVKGPRPFVVKEKIDPIPLKAEHQKIADDVIAHMAAGPSHFLIQGVTGSGKSIVYLEVMKHVLKVQQKSVLFLLPEINLTHQFLSFFSSLLGRDIPIFPYHSQVTPKQKMELWHYLKSEHAPSVILAARSGVFLPQNIDCPFGLIIMDEEHDSSYKQEDRCRFHTRNVAFKRSALEGSSVLLGSATPSIDTLVEFKDPARHTYRLLSKYHEQTEAPVIKQITPVNRKDDLWPLGAEVLRSIGETLARGGQTLVFANKLGHAHSLYCSICKHAFECPNCTIKLTYFKSKHVLRCHACEFSMAAPKLCPSCGSLDIFHHGFGTEKIHELLAEKFPQETILRFDRDEITTPKKLESVLGIFHRGEAKIMVGTQMLAKGHNFPNVQLIVVLGIDHQLHFPHFRASERVWQLLKQVIGRGGRRGQASEVLVVASEAAVLLTSLGDEKDDEFLAKEDSLRKLLKFPPYRQAAQLAIYDTDSIVARSEMLEVHKILKELLAHKKITCDIKSPRSTFVEKRQNYFGQVLELFSERPGELSKVLTYLQNKMKFKHSTKFIVDVDPENPW
jgi:primosomal protein N' (replication factor Y)